MESSPFITLDNISVRLRDQLYLHNTSWRLHSNEHWAVLGPNGSGKTTLVKSIFGGVPVVRGKIIHHYSTSNPHSSSANFKSIGYVSSDLQRDIIEREELKDSFRDFSGKIDEITTVEDIILDSGHNGFTDTKASARKVEMVAAKLGISDYLRRDIKSLSIGERSKALIARALIKDPQLLILDEPFEGLDLLSRKSMAAVIDQLMQDTMRVILITHRFNEIAPNISHILFLRNGEVLHVGKKEDIFKPKVIREVYEIEAETRPNAHDRIIHNISAVAEMTRRVNPDTRPQTEQTLIEMKNVTIKYGAARVLDGFNWTMKSKQNWAICGPAGSGKTTVLKLVLGEILQAYANEIYLFGKKKGTGESIWDIRKQVGYISSELQLRYPKHCTVLDTVCSGFFDSYGLYQRCSLDQIALAREWTKLFDVESLIDKNFGHLSHGQKQLILIARAMVKSPVLLMLDGPCDGLDIKNRTKILEIIDLIGHSTDTNLIYIPSMEEEIMPSITNVLVMEQGRVLKNRKSDDKRK